MTLFALSLLESAAALGHHMKRLGKYQLIAELARGGMGIVCLAVARSPGAPEKLVVVKTLRGDATQPTEALAMFREEARLSARLNHPHIVHTHDTGSIGDEQFLVMEYLEGVSFARALKVAPAMPMPVKLHVLCSVLDALHYAHTLITPDGKQAEIVHRDVTPSNVFLTFDGDVKLVDFGVAKSVQDPGLETRAGTFKGKPSYMAPEQVAGKFGPQVDVFAVGVMLWECVAGRRMWQGKTEVEIISGLLRGEIPRLDEAVADAPAELRRIVDKATAASLKERYATADDLLQDLGAYAATLQTAKGNKRWLAEIVSTAFADERAARQAAVAAAVEQQLQLSDSSSSALPVLAPAREHASGSGRVDSGSGARAAREASSTSHSTGLSAVGPPQPVRRGPGGLAIGGAALAAALVVGIVVARTGSGGGEAANGTPVRAVPPSASVVVVADAAPAVTAVAPATHHLAISIYPAGASITVNDSPRTNPFVDECAAGGALHVVASAPGYDASTRDLHCDRDQSYEIALTASPTRSSPGGRTAPVARPRIDPAATPPGPGRRGDDLGTLGGEDMRPPPTTPKPVPSLDTINSADLNGR